MSLWSKKGIAELSHPPKPITTTTIANTITPVTTPPAPTPASAPTPATGYCYCYFAAHANCCCKPYKALSLQTPKALSP